MHNRLSSLCRTTLLVADNQGSVHNLKLPLEDFDRVVQERIASTMRWMRSRWRLRQSKDLHQCSRWRSVPVHGDGCWRRHWLLLRWRRRSHCRWRRKDLLQRC